MRVQLVTPRGTPSHAHGPLSHAHGPPSERIRLAHPPDSGIPIRSVERQTASGAQRLRQTQIPHGRTSGSSHHPWPHHPGPSHPATPGPHSSSFGHTTSHHVWAAHGQHLPPHWATSLTTLGFNTLSHPLTLSPPTPSRITAFLATSRPLMMRMRYVHMFAVSAMFATVLAILAMSATFATTCAGTCAPTAAPDRLRGSATTIGTDTPVAPWPPHTSHSQSVPILGA